MAKESFTPFSAPFAEPDDVEETAATVSVSDDAEEDAASEEASADADSVAEAEDDAVPEVEDDAADEPADDVEAELLPHPVISAPAIAADKRTDNHFRDFIIIIYPLFTCPCLRVAV